jgi:hypothetical protein
MVQLTSGCPTTFVNVGALCKHLITSFGFRWISAGCFVICMVFDGTFQVMLQSVGLVLRFALMKICCIINRALTILLALLAAVFRIGA